MTAETSQPREGIDRALEHADRAGRLNAFRTVVSVISLVLIIALFMVWVVFGQSTVNHQNTQILSAVQTDLQHLEDHIDLSIQNNSIGDRVIVCLLNVEPDARTNATTQRCLTAARHGRDSIKVKHSSSPSPSP
jgi:hypothetical protein